MQERYSRNVPALSQAECALLRTKKVCVVGCGGLGGNLIEQLARIGVGAIRAIDGDVFEPSNLNRQLLCTVDLLGTAKAEAAAERIRRVNPDVEAESVHAFLDEQNAQALIQGCDVVLDALDNIDSRRILASACEKQNIPYVYGAISGWVAQAAVILPGDGMIGKLYPQGAAIRNKSVLAFAPALCASMQVALCTKLLTGRETEPGTLYYFDLEDMEFEIIPL